MLSVFHTIDICGKSQNGLRKLSSHPKQWSLTSTFVLCTPVTFERSRLPSWGDFLNKDECQIILMRFHIQHLCIMSHSACNGIIQAERTSFDPFLNFPVDWLSKRFKDISVTRSSVSSEGVMLPSIVIYKNNIKFAKRISESIFFWVGGVYWMKTSIIHYSSIFIKTIKIRCLILSS